MFREWANPPTYQWWHLSSAFSLPISPMYYTALSWSRRIRGSWRVRSAPTYPQSSLIRCMSSIQNRNWVVKPVITQRISLTSKVSHHSPKWWSRREWYPSWMNIWQKWQISCWLGEALLTNISATLSLLFTVLRFRWRITNIKHALRRLKWRRGLQSWGINGHLKKIGRIWFTISAIVWGFVPVTWWQVIWVPTWEWIIPWWEIPLILPPD